MLDLSDVDTAYVPYVPRANTFVRHANVDLHVERGDESFEDASRPVNVQRAQRMPELGIEVRSVLEAERELRGPRADALLRTGASSAFARSPEARLLRTACSLDDSAAPRVRVRDDLEDDALLERVVDETPESTLLWTARQREDRERHAQGAAESIVMTEPMLRDVVRHYLRVHFGESVALQDVLAARAARERERAALVSQLDVALRRWRTGDATGSAEHRGASAHDASGAVRVSLTLLHPSDRRFDVDAALMWRFACVVRAADLCCLRGVPEDAAHCVLASVPAGPMSLEYQAFLRATYAFPWLVRSGDQRDGSDSPLVRVDELLRGVVRGMRLWHLLRQRALLASADAQSARLSAVAQWSRLACAREGVPGNDARFWHPELYEWALERLQRRGSSARFFHELERQSYLGILRYPRVRRAHERAAARLVRLRVALRAVAFAEQLRDVLCAP